MNNYSFEKFVNNKELEGSTTYVVKQGDSLYKIANLYGVSVDEIVRYNKLQTTTIYPNQILFIPSNNKTYITRTGDTLSSISAKNGVSIDCLMKNNCFKDLVLSENQKINTMNHKELVITPGITLDDILKNYNITAYDLIILNKDKWLRLNEKIIVK
ncbi:MAG: LysM peptidoglycan-binding domain-containing protein [Anaeroplasmataceae bacterium]